MVLNVASGELDAVAWYKNTLEFQSKQGLKFKQITQPCIVMVSGNGCVQFPINEPASRNSQIQEFLDVNRGQESSTLPCKHSILCKRSHTCFVVYPSSQYPSYYTQLQQQGLPLSVAELENRSSKF